MDNAFRCGDAVTWLYTPRGGYGYTMPVDAVVVRVGEKRVTIRVTTRSGGFRDISVKPENLKTREIVQP